VTSTLQLAPGDIERLADLLADRLTDRPPAPARIVGVRELARILDVSPDAVYRHADQLGAIRVGSAVRFDVADAIERARTPATPPAPAPAVTARTRRRARTAGATELLPIRGQERRP
jgi:hypothetical protein